MGRLVDHLHRLVAAVQNVQAEAGSHWPYMAKHSYDLKQLQVRTL